MTREEYMAKLAKIEGDFRAAADDIAAELASLAAGDPVDRDTLFTVFTHATIGMDALRSLRSTPITR